MIISHKYKFIFIKTYKTAGTSLEAYLSDYCGEDDVITEIFPPVSGHWPRNAESFYNHMPAVEVRHRVGEALWHSYFKFCVERNPWEKVLSFYWMERSRNGEGLDFDEFLARDQIGFNWPLYADECGESPIIDRILRYERLGDDLTKLFKELGVPWAGSLEYRAKSEYRQDRRHYREILSSHQANYIAKRFVKEIEWHGYQY
jgi:hypothetical protein